MKIESKQIYEATGVVAIVVSLLFVTLELRQANRIAQASAEAQLREIAISTSIALMESPELSTTMSKLRANSGEEITPSEYEAARAFFTTQIATLSVAQQYWERGLLSEYSYGIYYNLADNFMENTPGSVPIYADLVRFYDFRVGMSPMWDSLLDALIKRDPSFEY